MTKEELLTEQDFLDAVDEAGKPRQEVISNGKCMANFLSARIKAKAKRVWRVECANAWGENKEDWRSSTLTHTALLICEEKI